METNDAITDLEGINQVFSSVIEKHTYDIIAIKKTIDSLAGIEFEWDEKCREAREREEGD